MVIYDIDDDKRMDRLERMGLCPRCESQLLTDSLGRCKCCGLCVPRCIDERREDLYLKDEVYSS